MDAVVYDDENNYYILDYKTGSVPQEPENDLQTIVYMCALAISLKKNYKTLRFVYLDLKNNAEKVVESSQIHPEIIEQILAQIEREKFQPTDDKKTCATCEYRMFC